MTFRHREPRFGGTGYGHIREWAFEGDPKAILQVGKTERILRYQDRHILYALSGRYSVKQGGTARGYLLSRQLLSAGQEFLFFKLSKPRKAPRAPKRTGKIYGEKGHNYGKPKHSLQDLPLGG